jgi:hypothetical protein
MMLDDSIGDLASTVIPLDIGVSQYWFERQSSQGINPSYDRATIFSGIHLEFVMSS